ncbi:MAG TPA: TatD family hydrolase [Gaiellaceae bacterium]
MIDTHAHLDALDGEAREALARARAAGVERVIAVGTNLESARETLAICEGEEGVFAALSIHPHEAASANEADLQELRKLSSHEKVVAVGETGLDYFRDYAPPAAQRDLFRRLTGYAREAGLPIVVHSRAADEDTAAILGEIDDVPVVLHCFSSLGLLGPALEHGWYVSFAGNVTYPNAEELRTAAARVPSDRLLAETDSPYLAPQPVRGRRNEPANVMHTLTSLAEVRGEDRDELERRIDANATAAFQLP